MLLLLTHELVSAREHIKVEEEKFTGGIAVDDQGNLYVPNPPPVLYVGDPHEHAEIDEHWEKATWSENLSFLEHLMALNLELMISWGTDIVLQGVMFS